MISSMHFNTFREQVGSERGRDAVKTGRELIIVEAEWWYMGAHHTLLPTFVQAVLFP